MDWKNNATRIINDWLVSDEARAALWQAAAQDARTTMTLVLGDSGSELDAASAQLASSLRLAVSLELVQVGVNSPWLALMIAAVLDADWRQIADAFLAGLPAAE